MTIAVTPEHTFAYMTPEHLEAVLELDCKSCLYYDEDIEMEIVHPHAWTQQALLKFLKQRVPPTHGYIMRLKGSKQIVGYMAYEILPEAVHLLAFVVDPDLRRKGLGVAMLLKLHEVAQRKYKRTKLSIHVREHDDASIGFFSSVSFTSKLVFRYFEDGEDAILFEFNKLRVEAEDEE